MTKIFSLDKEFSYPKNMLHKAPHTRKSPLTVKKKIVSWVRKFFIKKTSWTSGKNIDGTLNN